MARQITANDVINRAALEVGLLPANDAVASTDESFIQMRGLLDAAGQELVELHPWQFLRGVFSFVTTGQDSGTYDLPDDRLACA